MRSIVAVLASILLMFASFYILYYISLVQTQFMVMFPTKSCDPIIEAYGSNLERFAYRDYLSAEANWGKPTQGQLQCFCRDKSDAENGSEEYYGKEESQDGEGAQMCMYYNNMQLAGLFVTNSLGYVITGVNWFIRTMIISFITWINFKTETIQLVYITKFTFWL